VNAVSAELAAERQRFAAERTRLGVTFTNSPHSDLDTAAIKAEVQRVEKVLRDIALLIDDPSTELSMVIRKNVEKAELDAYLKGILFSLGRANTA
jgi:hypothetical protein